MQREANQAGHVNASDIREDLRPDGACRDHAKPGPLVGSGSSL
jgi:hypothetical protein